MWAKMLRALLRLCLLLCMLPAVAEAVEVSATAAVLLDADTGQVLYEKNGDEQMLIASTTKIMTALVVLEQAGLDDTVTVTRDHMAEGSSMYLKPGETVRVEELLYGLLLCSGNDAALALTACAGGPESFVALMNEKAVALGMTRTSFAIPTDWTPRGTTPRRGIWQYWPPQPWRSLRSDASAPAAASLSASTPWRTTTACCGRWRAASA